LTGLAAAPQATASPLVRIDIVDREHGHWLPTYQARHDTWIAGTPGHRYGVRLTNTSGERVLVVLSIDGVNAVSGQTAHPSQTGYVLAPFQSAEINGWRKSHRDLAAFVFTALDDSYAARTGRPDNVGTIGVAVFRERSLPRPVHTSPPIARRLDAHATDRGQNGRSRTTRRSGRAGSRGLGRGAVRGCAETADRHRPRTARMVPHQPDRVCARQPPARAGQPAALRLAAGAGGAWNPAAPPPPRAPPAAGVPGCVRARSPAALALSATRGTRTGEGPAWPALRFHHVGRSGAERRRSDQFSV